MTRVRTLWLDLGFRRKLRLVLGLVAVIVAAAMLLALYQQQVITRNVVATRAAVDRMQELARLEEALGQLREAAYWYGESTSAKRRAQLLDSSDTVKQQIRRLKPSTASQREASSQMLAGLDRSVAELVRTATPANRREASAIFFSNLTFDITLPAKHLSEDISRDMQRDHHRFVDQTQRGFRLIVTSLVLATVAIMLIATLIPTSIVRRLESLRAAVHRIALGSRSLRVDIPGNDEVAQLARGFNTMSAALEMRELENRRLVEEQRDIAMRDGLTGLYNRRYFMEQLDVLLALNARKRVGVALAILDLDNFKQVNDTLGHPAGDAVLVRVAEVLNQQVRSEDIPCRIGGEEFGVLFIGSAGRDAIAALERAAADLAVSVDGATPVTFSAGFTTALPGETGEDLYARSDEAAYRSKLNGKDQITVSEPPDPSIQHAA